MRFTFAVVLGCLAVMLAPVVPASANALNINYYTIGETDKDANHLAFGNFNNEVQNTLGPDGLPILNTTAYGCTVNCISPTGMPTDLTSGGEITYWSPLLNNGGKNGASDVTFTASGTVSLPYSHPQNFFPPNGTGSNDSNGFQAATLSGQLVAASTEQISFSIGADDMAFAYLDGNLVCDLGGVHSSASGSCLSPFNISAGAHELQVFFVDINNSQAGLSFNVTTANVTTSVPEPATAALFCAGLAGLGVVRRRGKR